MRRRDIYPSTSNNELMFQNSQYPKVLATKEEIQNKIQNEPKMDMYDMVFNQGYKKAVDEFISFCKQESDITNFGVPYGISFKKMDKIQKEMDKGCNKCEHYKDYDYCDDFCNK